MALIKCPECGKEISDRSPACIHCGFPLELLKSSSGSGIDEAIVEKDTDKDVEDDTLCEKEYSLELLDYGNEKVQVAVALKNTLKMKDAEALELVASAPCYLFRGKQEHIIAPKMQKLNSLPVEYNLYLDGKLKKHKSKIEIDKPDNYETKVFDSYTKKIKCPNCSSLIPETSRACPECDFDGISSYLLQLERERQSKIIDYTHQYEPVNGNNVAYVPKCPTCGSPNIKKISGLSKAGSVALWGIFSRKVYKQWHCNSCGSEW